MKKFILLILPFVMGLSIFAANDSLESSKLHFEKRFAQLESKLFRREIANSAFPMALKVLPYSLATIGLCAATQKPMMGLGILAVSGATYGLQNVLLHIRNMIVQVSLVNMVGECELLNHDIQHHELSKKNTRWSENFLHQIKAIKLKCLALIDSFNGVAESNDGK